MADSIEKLHSIKCVLCVCVCVYIKLDIKVSDIVVKKRIKLISKEYIEKELLKVAFKDYCFSKNVI